MDQQRLQAELDFIQGQQQELEQLIEPLESAAATTSPAQHQGDRQRENMYHIAQASIFFYFNTCFSLDLIHFFLLDFTTKKWTVFYKRVQWI